MRDYFNITNECNLELMKRYEDNYFDLAIVDPPYGINASKGIGKYSLKKYGKINKNWDNETPKKEYWNELFRVSKNQIVCGANYFLENLYSTKSFICWVKNNPAPTFAQAELLWTSFDVNGKVFDTGRQIIHQIQKDGGSIHPTQKPTDLYQWLLKNYAQPNQKILDTHLGSGSIAIAIDALNKIEKMNLTLTACELDKDYYKNAVAKIEEETKWNSLF